jgi:hypothetical protein
VLTSLWNKHFNVEIVVFTDEQREVKKADLYRIVPPLSKEDERVTEASFKLAVDRVHGVFYGLQ